MAKLSSIKTDAQKETEGVWVDYDMGIELKIARIGNTAFDAMIKKLTEPMQKGMRTGRISDDKIEELTKKACAKHILVDWKNIEDEEGKPLKHSPKKALELLTDPSLRDFYKFVIVTANEAERYRQELDEESEGN